MKKKILVIMLCCVMLGLVGCNKEKINVDVLNDTYNKIAEYFGSEEVDRSNLGAYYLDEEKHVVIVNLIDNSKEKQENFLKNVNVSSKYIQFEQGGPYTTSGIDFYLSKEENYNDIKFNEYITFADRKYYLANNVKEFYVVVAGKIMILRAYLTNFDHTLDDYSIKRITDELTKEAILKDGGTTIYKSKDKDVTIIECHTIDGNDDIYIGDYLMEFVEKMCK